MVTSICGGGTIMRKAIVTLLILADLLLTNCGISTSAQSIFPTPGPGRSRYSNPQFGYVVTYPSQWNREDSGNHALVRFIPATSQRVPDAEALDITCAPNPKGLNSEAWWLQSQQSARTQTAVGSLKLKSGVDSYVAEGHGQVNFTVYTVMRGHVACQLTAYDIDKLNNPFVVEAVNTFTWR
jgi:hypothetical protein